MDTPPDPTLEKPWAAVMVDHGATVRLLNSCLIILPDGPSSARHITVTHEGIVIDMVRDGEIVATATFLHDDMTPDE